MATTDIYTYLHTLSLHNALPIYGEQLFGGANHPEMCMHPFQFVRHTENSQGHHLIWDCWTSCETGSAWRPRSSICMCDLARKHAGVCRSEEHTSELQSLMRNSYDVFCLTKNTISKSHLKT